MKKNLMGSMVLGFCLTSCGRDTVTKIQPSGVNPSAEITPVGIQVSVASNLICSNGGNTIAVFSDSNRDGIFQNTETMISENTICNGADGSNGQNGTNGSDAHFFTGTVGNLVPNKSYSACHHDYLYFPDNENGPRGWLLFRHQSNGSADQGIGSTGFQVWNVDIVNFSLASEVGGVTYCNLVWDPLLKTLNYTVVDNSDGLAGSSGTIQF